MKLNQYFQNGAAIIDLRFLQNVPLIPATLSPQRGQKFMKIKQNVYEGSTFSNVNFIIIYPLVSKIDRENLKISAIIGRYQYILYEAPFYYLFSISWY